MTLLIVIFSLAFVCLPLTPVIGKICCYFNSKSRFADLDYRNRFQKRMKYVCMGVMAIVILIMLVYMHMNS